MKEVWVIAIVDRDAANDDQLVYLNSNADVHERAWSKSLDVATKYPDEGAAAEILAGLKVSADKYAFIRTIFIYDDKAKMKKVWIIVQSFGLGDMNTVFWHGESWLDNKAYAKQYPDEKSAEDIVMGFEEGGFALMVEIRAVYVENKPYRA